MRQDRQAAKVAASLQAKGIYPIPIAAALLQEKSSTIHRWAFGYQILQRPELANAWDIRVWVDAPFDITVPRAVSRDARGTNAAAVIRSRYETRYVPGQLMYMNQCCPGDTSDIVVNNADLAEPQVGYRRFRQAF